MAGETLTVDELRTMLKEALQPGGNSGAPPTQPGATPAPASGLLNTLIQKLDALITAITGSKTADKLSDTTQVALAVTGLKDASNLASRAITDLAVSVPVFGRALKAAGVDLNEYLKLLIFAFLEKIDSVAWAIASKPADALIVFDELMVIFGIKEKKSGLSKLCSIEYLTFLI